MSISPVKGCFQVWNSLIYQSFKLYLQNNLQFPNWCINLYSELQQTLLTFVFILTKWSSGQWERIYGYYATFAKTVHHNVVSDPFIICTRLSHKQPINSLRGCE